MVIAQNVYSNGPRLLADVDAAHARFALETAPGRIEAIEVLACDAHSSLLAAVRAYLARTKTRVLRHAAVAIANPVAGDQVRMTNRPWQFSIEKTRRALGLETLLVVNDFTALAQALPHLRAEHKRQVGGGVPARNAVIGVVGPGTGLGVSGLIPVQDGWITLGSEGGHASFSPHDERELAVLHDAWREFDHVSFERLVSATGIELIYRALAHRAQAKKKPLGVDEIVRRALAGDDALCTETIDCFCAMLGSVAGNLALTLGALGGVYLGGRIVPRLGPLFDHSPFRARFERKGRFSAYLAQIPTYVITAEQPAFLGVAAILAEHLRGRTAQSPLLDRVRLAQRDLTPAEQRVAGFVLQHPRAVLSAPVAEIARRAQVSQPTVIRFCRSLGCAGLADFKLKLASGLTHTVPVRHSQVHATDAASNSSVKVLDNALSAIVKLRDDLNNEAVDRAIDFVRRARHVELYGLDESSVAALAGQYQFLRLRIPAVARADPHWQAVSAELLGKDDVLIAFSDSGRTPDLLHAVELALAVGAHVVAITRTHSPLAKKASVTLCVDHDEGSSAYAARVSRILQLLLIDVLAVGIGMNRRDAEVTQETRGMRNALS